VSDSTTPEASSAWQTSLASLETEALQVWRSDEEQVSQVQAKRQQARAAAAHLVAAQQLLAARQGQAKDRHDENLGALRSSVEQAEVAQRQAVAEYERALKEFHKQREKLRKERAVLTRRRQTLMTDLPDTVRRAYAALLASDVPDPVALVRDGRCVACRHTLPDASNELPIRCPSCGRLLVHSVA
jgi:predicted  nucleic acid-binding Zn-ribbon protein